MEGRNMFYRLALACAFVFNAIFLCSASFADDKKWPDRPIHIIVPLPAGSAADTVARLIGSKLSAELGQPVIINDQAGGSGEIGTVQIAKAEPDGYTLGIATTTTLVTAPILSQQLRYDALKDFIPIAMVGYSPYGDASLAHLAGELFASLAGVSLNQIPYKTSTQAVLDLLAGRIDSQFGILTTTHQYIRDGKLNALGITTLKRVPEFPDIPTISESGLPDYEASLWLAIIAPAKTPPAIVTRLNTEINQMLSQQSMRTILFNQAIIADPGSPADLHNKIETDLKRWKDLATKAGLV